MGREFMLNKIEQVEKERKRLQSGAAFQETEKQRQRGKLLARERVERLLDSGTFCELEIWAKPVKTGFEIDDQDIPGDAVVTGYGKIDGRTVLVYAHDYIYAGGSHASVHHSKVTRVMETAVRMGLPYIGLVDSGGMRIQDQMGYGTWNTPTEGMGIASGSWMFSPSWASGVVPQISLMLGPNYAGSAYSPIQADFVIMQQGSYMSLVSPSVIKEVTHVNVTQEDIGGARLHAEVSGTCDLIGDTEESCFILCRRLLSYLPSNNRESSPVLNQGHDQVRNNEEILGIIPESSFEAYDMHAVITRIVDSGTFFEVKPLYARNMIVGFARMGGQSVGIIANNPLVKGGAIDADGSDKEARFIRFCDAFNIPLIFLVDTVGYLPDHEAEKSGFVRHAAKVAYAICEATVPKITVYIRNCLGQGRIAMCNAQMGGDLVLAWPTARVGFIDPVTAVETIYGKDIEESKTPDEMRRAKIEGFESNYNTLFHWGGRQLFQDIIDPRETRAILIRALEWYTNKREEDRPWKKHGNIPF